MTNRVVRVGRDNAEQNNVDAQFFLPDSLPQGQFDVVVANILANPLRMLGEMLAARTKQGGRIVLSGLLMNIPKNSAAFTANGSISTRRKLTKAGRA